MNVLAPYIDQIFTKIGITNRFCVEFGTYNALDDLTTKLIRQDGWSGMYIECDEHQYNQIVFNCIGFPVTVVKGFITAENINELFAQGKVPTEFDFLSIDVDGMDYWIWKSLTYRPRVLCIEYNGLKVPPELAVQSYNPNNVWNHSRWFGASLQSLVNLGKTKGYELIGCDAQGANAFFVVKEEFDKIGISDNSAVNLFVHANYGVEADGGHPYPDGPYLEI
jgi:hypothetical protein